VLLSHFDQRAIVLARKALWYRRIKSTLQKMTSLGIPLTKDMTLKDAMERVDVERREARTPEEREADALRMFQRTTKGALNASVDKTKLSRVLRSGKAH
jgi:hypothetical protein